ncbi:hypothetical protein CGGC5_v013348 [Colletotrichum fructicola Nara gc5]|uniref:Uncharacterized protein n=1 Tax=Colletotrichum fructicola (strain Nara gc5) TaxID=1213859 RepID=L2FBH5_COLFN|nr:hypothetical protein CGGC5_v013348 [Colletotrichum fructicola Nara gc5]KAF4885124.1 hypothetical protein CGCFRS4_v012200 [Colletotrichum fructicola]
MNGPQNWSRESLPNYTDNFLVSPADLDESLIYIQCQEKLFRISFSTIRKYSTYFQRPRAVYVIDDQTPETVGAYLYFNERLVFSTAPEHITPFSSVLPDSWEMKTTLAQKLHLRYVEQHIGDILTNWRHYYRHPVDHDRRKNPQWCVLDNFGAAYQLCVDMRWDLQASAIVQSFVRNIRDEEWDHWQENVVDESLAFFWRAENGLAEIREARHLAEVREAQQLGEVRSAVDIYVKGVLAGEALCNGR